MLTLIPCPKCAPHQGGRTPWPDYLCAVCRDGLARLEASVTAPRSENVAKYPGGTFTRPRGTLYGVEAVRCAAHSEFAPDGFAVARTDDPPGDRCWSPVVGRACQVCGRPS